MIAEFHLKENERTRFLLNAILQSLPEIKCYIPNKAIIGYSGNFTSRTFS